MSRLVSRHNRIGQVVALAGALAACSGAPGATMNDGPAESTATSIPTATTTATSTSTAMPTATSTTTAMPTSTATSTSTATPSGGDLVGTWTSPSCGARKYAREITFESGGKFSAKDLVSPCPPKAHCIWSGIVDRAGTFEKKETQITLTVTSTPGNKAGEAFPQSLTFDKELRESSGGATCSYARR